MLLLGLVQSLGSTLVFILRKPRHVSNFILAAWFLIISLFFLGLLIPEGLTTYTKIGFIPFFMLTGPLFYFYVRSLIHPNFEFKWPHLVHCIPFALVGGLRVAFIPESLSLNSEHLPEREINPYISAMIFILSISFFSYWVATLLLLLKHRKNVLNYFSTKSGQRTLSWVLLIMLVALLSHIIFLSPSLVQVYFSSLQTMSFWVHQFNIALLGYLLLVFGLTQPIIFESPTSAPVSEVDSSLAREKYARSGLSDEQMQFYAQQVVVYLEEEKPYKNPEFSLTMMIEDLNITQQNLSQTINEVLEKNFYQLVNEYRVKEFKQLLQDSKAEQLTFLGLAYEAGFNSKSSFNRVFKEVTDQTPSQYSQSLKVSSEKV
ncbi:MAG: helix-turn-helix domain-containing protein [Cyclobacteriaceae bacterium]